MYILLFQNVSKMYFQECDVVEDGSFNSYRIQFIGLLCKHGKNYGVFLFLKFNFFFFLDPKCICSLCLKILLLVLEWSFL